MIYWLIIILGIFVLSISISNPFYKLMIKKYLKSNILFEIILRSFLFFLSIVIILIGLYLDSVT